MLRKRGVFDEVPLQLSPFQCFGNDPMNETLRGIGREDLRLVAPQSSKPNHPLVKRLNAHNHLTNISRTKPAEWDGAGNFTHCQQAVEDGVGKA